MATAIFRLSASTSSSVVGSVLRCKLDCMNRKDKRSMRLSVDDPSAVYVRRRQPGRLLLAIRYLRPSHTILFCSDSAFGANCPVRSVLAAGLYAVNAPWGFFLSGPTCYASVLPAAVHALLGHVFAESPAVSIAEAARTLH
ncbi:hypothetical protein EVAR_87742_1 [Eumeta japonica]|uniref:Uncharacterized protein n=1 Tax=Eumeta variegata TaxID=151549 RepID=A0A4C1ZM49_EUMVA|nr:hypothetical protein EVAR_87742_1 [Eumeta japonica]